METTLATLTRTIFLIALLVAPSAFAGDVEDLSAQLHEFLATVSEKNTHDRFWAEDLIYTSSSGTRFDKATIMKGFEDAGDTDSGDGTAYTAEEVQVNVYGDTAIVAFKLIATPADESAVQNYFNTGTFVRRDGAWKAVAWQATKIPPAE